MHPLFSNFMRAVLIVLFALSGMSLQAQSTVIRSNDFNFTWPLPESWMSAVPLTDSQYVVKAKSGSPMTCAIMVKPAGKMTLSTLLEKQDSDPQFFFNGAKRRFPEARFHKSSRTKLGSQDAVMTEYYYTMSNINKTMTAFVIQIVTIRNGLVFVVSFECMPDDIDNGKAEMSRLLGAFSFRK